ncbi:MAG TPA: 2-C-methyl-D-erythritol 4-phosphate cytidylyltransferase [Thermomicrobiales bacterium]|nr:2-C-methyl-D-erythritol 4-phosphate cytidylyltransferase [Thermomicrobiales bacterium]
MTDRFAGVIIVAAGRGERFGDSGKVLAYAGGRPLLARSLDAAIAASSTAEIVVVCGGHTRERIAALIESLDTPLPVCVCAGGAERQDSVRFGIHALSDSIEVAVIHDAARPLATSAMFDDVAEAAREQGAAIVAVPVTDTIKEVEGDRILRTIPRQMLRAAQTPQAFRLDTLWDAMERTTGSNVTFTDEATRLESLGVPVVVRPGTTTNIKVTVPEDLVLVEALLQSQCRGTRDVPS